MRSLRKDKKLFVGCVNEGYKPAIKDDSGKVLRPATPGHHWIVVVSWYLVFPQRKKPQKKKAACFYIATFVMSCLSLDISLMLQILDVYLSTVSVFDPYGKRPANERRDTTIASTIR
jgi:hypothetical protein